MAADSRSSTVRDNGSVQTRHRSVYPSLIAAACATLILGGCRTATDTRGHQRLAAETIVKQAAEQGVELDDASCEKPTSSKVGTDFKCTAKDRDGFEFRFTATIAEDDSYDITPNG